MMYKRAELSECELITMKCIWDANEPITCQEIMAKLRSTYELDYKDTTVYTFLKNLKEKGFVESYRRGVTFYYAARDEQEYRDGELKKAEDFWFDGSSSKLVSALFDLKKIDEKEREEIQKLIDELD